MEIPAGKGGAVGGDQQPCPLIERRLHRQQLDLNGPLFQAGYCGGRQRGVRSLLRQLCGLTAGTTAHLHGHTAGAAAAGHRGAADEGLRLFGQLGGGHRFFVKGGSFPLHKGDGVGGAVGQAVAQAVAVVVPQQDGLAVYHADGALLTGIGAGAAAVAAVAVDFNNSPYHIGSLLFSWLFVFVMTRFSLVFPRSVSYNIKVKSVAFATFYLKFAARFRGDFHAGSCSGLF